MASVAPATSEPGATRWALARTSPVLLDQGRVSAVAGLARQRTGAQLALGGLMALALAAIVVARVPGLPGAPGAGTSPSSSSLVAVGSPQPSQVITLPPTGSSEPSVSVPPTPTPPPSPTPTPTPPPSPTPTATPTPTPSPPAPEFVSYKVKNGDTLYDLAIRFNTTVKAIQALNGMGRSTALRIGQTLKIPQG